VMCMFASAAVLTLGLAAATFFDLTFDGIEPPRGSIGENLVMNVASKSW